MKNKKKIIFSFLSVSMFSVLFLLSNTWASENNATVYVDYGMTINTETPNLFGICHYPPENRISAVMPLIQNAGFNTIRYDFYYENIIPSSICPSLDYYKANTNNIQDPNSWNWSGLFWLTDAYNRGMRIMAISTYCPTWLSYSGTNTGVPKDWDVYQDIVKKVYQKYKSMITRVEMYNEIDYFLDLTNSPYSSKNVAITDMYYYAASAIRSIDSNAVIGGIAPAYYNEQQQYEELLSNSRLQPSSNLFNFFTYHSYCMTPPGGCNNYRDTCKDHGYPYTIPGYISEWNISYNPDPRENTYTGISWISNQLNSFMNNGLGSYYYGLNGTDEDPIHPAYIWNSNTNTATLEPQMVAWNPYSMIGLGVGNSIIKYSTVSGVTSSSAGINSENQPFVTIANDSSSITTVDVTLNNLNVTGTPTIKVFSASQGNDGSTYTTVTPTVSTGEVTFTVTLPAYSSTGILVVGTTSIITGNSIFRIHNRWTGDSMYMENQTGKVELGAIISSWWSSQFYFSPTDSNYGYMQNRWQNQYLHIEDRFGYVEYTSMLKPGGMWSSQWMLQPVDWAQGYFNIVNRLQPQVMMHEEDKLGYVEEGTIGNTDWSTGEAWSAQWLLQPVY